jgi:hypothetical protein
LTGNQQVNPAGELKGSPVVIFWNNLEILLCKTEGIRYNYAVNRTKGELMSLTIVILIILAMAWAGDEM